MSPTVNFFMTVSPSSCWTFFISQNQTNSCLTLDMNIYIYNYSQIYLYIFELILFNLSIYLFIISYVVIFESLWLGTHNNEVNFDLNFAIPLSFPWVG